MCDLPLRHQFIASSARPTETSVAPKIPRESLGQIDVIDDDECVSIARVLGKRPLAFTHEEPRVLHLRPFHFDIAEHS
jgi:hypothetical protein